MEQVTNHEIFKQKYLDIATESTLLKDQLAAANRRLATLEAAQANQSSILSNPSVIDRSKETARTPSDASYAAVTRKHAPSNDKPKRKSVSTHI
ncbi:hypothetical protein RMATCC62417_13474 [Rhizopus microsporus]|nr:hypothetical protein RMATCC62417_13474 [Rhizopus microsporus]